MTRRAAIAAVAVLACVALAGCSGRPTPSPAEQQRMVEEVKAAVGAIDGVTAVGPTYNPDGPLEPSRLSLSVPVRPGRSRETVAVEVTRIVWTSKLAPLDYFDITVGYPGEYYDTAHEVHVNLTDAATVGDLTRRYGARPIAS